ncbi:MAG TPA: hypothetical protein VHE82_00485, partial [Gemmatimonadaceae bacterium]|nr:hypothetical protein [Gemmatimonadaceae bacterium]
MTHHPSLLLACGALALAACSDPVTSPILKAPTTVSLLLSTGTPTIPTDQHVFLMSGNSIPDNFAADVAAAGGTVVRLHSEIGVAVVKGLTDAAANQLARGNGKVERDVMVQWVP